MRIVALGKRGPATSEDSNLPLREQVLSVPTGTQRLEAIIGRRCGDYFTPSKAAKEGIPTAHHKVTEVVDGDTFDITPNWRWNGKTGKRVRVAHYDAPELNEPGGKGARRLLATLLNGLTVAITKKYTLDRGRLVCDIAWKSKDGDYDLARTLHHIEKSA